MDVVKKIENAAGDLAAAAVWVEAHKAEIPPYVYNAVLLLAMLRAELTKARQRASDLLALFRRELGITPKSERGPSPKPTNSTKSPLTDAERLAALKARRAQLLKEIRRYEDRLGKGRKKRHKRAAAPSAPAGDEPLPSDNTASPRADPVAATLAPSGEAVFSGDLTNFNEVNTAMKIKREEKFSNPRGLHSVTDERTRWNFAVTTTKINLKVETVTDPRTGKSVTASTDEIGPPNSQATWSGIANTIIAVVSYAIPINRLANMLKHTAPYFTSSRLCSYLKLAAEMFAPIYTYLGEQLADADILMGDDTTARVLEVNRALKDGGELAEAKVGSLIARMGAVFGRVFDKKSGKGKKRQLNVSLIVGKSVAGDPRSYIFFFRAHLGGLGDLISKIIETRSPKRSALTLVSDLATTNLLAAKFYKQFKIKHAGCAAHARRPFWRHRDKDQKLCYWMLSAFLVLEQIEDRIDELGRTERRVARYRNRYSRKVWDIILRRCESLMRGETIHNSHWKPTSKLYGACAYIVKHYPQLTAYLDDIRLPSNNNLCERLLRWDKIMEDASKFRKTEAGRLNIDILRTVVHTCSAAKVELKDYLLFVFKNRADIEDDPSQFTPYAFALRLDAEKGVQKTVPHRRLIFECTKGSAQGLRGLCEAGYNEQP